jgi:CBS domain containing-hemolysin-like protein
MGESAVHLLLPYTPWLVAMELLILCSAFFSGSEAALFYLGHSERRALAAGNPAQRVAAKLLARPDRLLTAVLFWNLVVNLAYFTIASITSLQLERDGHTTMAGGFAVGSLLVIIIFSEMLPKSLAVLLPKGLAALVALPLAMMVRVLRPVFPVFHLANLLSRRLLLPRFRSEPYLRVGDLERAVQLSTSDASLLEQEQNVLQNLVLLSELRVDELMRPRILFRSFRPPVSLEDLEGRIPPSGYLLVTEPESDEVAAAIPLRRLSSIPSKHLEHYAEAVVCVPWCTTVAKTLELMQRQDRQVAVVVNEFGETIGILTFEDLLDTIFSPAPSRSERLLQGEPIRQVGPQVWTVTGMTSLRRLSRYFHIERPPSQSVTVAGIIQEELERLPQTGDECRWGPFQLKVLAVEQRGRLLAELTLVDPPEGAP